MIRRHIESELKTLITEYPVVTVLGPRQAGKTTLARTSLTEYDYSNLEEPQVRRLAQSDPKGYLSQFKNPVIIDEIQRVPELLSYIQVIVDEQKKEGAFVLTGSHQLSLQEAITQSLAGRTAILKLLPLSIRELNDHHVSFEHFSDYCFHGFLPRIYEKKVRVTNFYSNYYQTYVERDLKQLIKVKDLSLFEKFFHLLAGRVGQVMDYSSLSNNVGVDSKTLKSWLSVLEASFIIFKLPPYFANFGKRVIKSPKYYFVDVGLLCYLLGIEEASQVTRDPLVGQIFENLVILEFLKSRYNEGRKPHLYFFRDSNGNEVDLVLANGRSLTPIEIKSSSTFHPKFLKGLKSFRSLDSNITPGIVVYNGDYTPSTEEYQVHHFRQI